MRLCTAAILACSVTACGTSPPERSSVVYESTSREAIRGCARYQHRVEAIASERSVDPGLVAGIVTVESRWHPRAKSSAGARGLMQIMPSTGRRLRCGDLFDPRENLRCGTQLLDRLLRRYDGRVDYALAAYALGPRKPDRAFERGEAAPRQRFIKKVLAARERWLEHGCKG